MGRKGTDDQGNSRNKGIEKQIKIGIPMYMQGKSSKNRKHEKRLYT